MVVAAYRMGILILEKRTKMQFEQFRGIVEKYGDFHASQKVIRVIDFPGDQFALIDLQNILEELEVSFSAATIHTYFLTERANLHVMIRTTHELKLVESIFNKFFQKFYSGRIIYSGTESGLFLDFDNVSPINVGFLFLALRELNISPENVMIQVKGYNESTFVYAEIT